MTCSPWRSSCHRTSTRKSPPPGASGLAAITDTADAPLGRLRQCQRTGVGHAGDCVGQAARRSRAGFVSVSTVAAGLGHGGGCARNAGGRGRGAARLAARAASATRTRTAGASGGVCSRFCGYTRRRGLGQGDSAAGAAIANAAAATAGTAVAGCLSGRRSGVADGDRRGASGPALYHPRQRSRFLQLDKTPWRPLLARRLRRRSAP